MTLLSFTRRPVTPTRVREVVTVHTGTDLALRLALLDAIEQTLQRHGVERSWIETAGSQLVVVADLPSA
ncbi:hypothetical protein [Nocardioides mangrovi]|uniref:Uncharacterized protein n=1 Tax=Nocardioides mangrovi TaxID=2874580 RepID=A0ABS7UJ71_9ACTN|nr:hypothetical protein [Nocardioides mangrovi]MBZ5740706.1 hypothetical protein [Nocardioides mangrovi]